MAESEAVTALPLKIVYDGPPIGGKTRTFGALHKALQARATELTPVAVEGDRILYFHFEAASVEFDSALPDIPLVVGVYTCPGSVYFKSTRDLVRQGAHGIVFVPSLVAHMQEDNRPQLSRVTSQCDGAPILLQLNPGAHPAAGFEFAPEAVLEELGASAFPTFVCKAGSPSPRDVLVAVVARALRTLLASGRAPPLSTVVIDEPMIPPKIEFLRAQWREYPDPRHHGGACPP